MAPDFHFSELQRKLLKTAIARCDFKYSPAAYAPIYLQAAYWQMLRKAMF
jgi:hypothetical protein